MPNRYDSAVQDDANRNGIKSSSAGNRIRKNKQKIRYVQIVLRCLSSTNIFYIPNDSLKTRNAYSQNMCITFLFISIAQTEDELKRVNHEKDRVEKEKDDKIKELEIKINSMGLAYENVLNVSLFNYTSLTQPF